MSLEIERAEATLGAFVRGVELAALDTGSWRAIEAAFHAHAVLIFPGQHLGRREQAAFGRRFGELDPLVASTGTLPISNRKPDGTLRDDADPVKQILLGNEGWHTDSSYMPVSARASLLSAEIVTERGGETEWADMRAAYDALDDATRARIAPLAAYH
jgi:alpha-ketoglutarate-dependent taurine dioxygenase